MFTKHSLPHYLTYSFIYSTLAAALSAIALLVWQAAMVRNEVIIAESVRVGPFALITLSKHYVNGVSLATFGLGDGWPGYLAAWVSVGMLVGVLVWRKKRRHSADTHTQAGTGDV